jgi:flagellar basal-body rod protein FlgF
MPYDYATVDAVMGSLVNMRNMEIISNNLANANTNGFKSDRLIFNDLMTRETQTVFEQGPLRQTGNPLDVAIQGDGFLRVRTPEGMRLSRDGALHINQQGALVDSRGNAVLGAGGQPVNVDPLGPPVSIGAGGAISQGSDVVGELGMVEVTDKATLVKTGDNYFSGPEGAAPVTRPAAGSTLSQGYLESANTSVVEEMVNMIATFRAYESYQKIMHTLQDIDSKCINQVGRSA